MENSKNILITGCNKGVGYGILENLAARPEKHRFIMAVRNVSFGKTSLEELEKTISGVSERVKIMELDITKSESIDAFLVKLGEKIDCLINNAGTAIPGDIFNQDPEKLNEEKVNVTFNTNFYGTIEFTEKMLPHISEGGKVIFITSGLGNLSKIQSGELKKRFDDPEITREKIFALAKKFHDDVVSKTFVKEGWSLEIYSVSKLCMNIYTRWLGKTEDILKRGIQVYACCPGWVRTDLGGSAAPRSIQEGSVCPSTLACFPYKIDPEKQGKFFSDSVVSSL